MKVHLQLVIFHFLVSSMLFHTSTLETSEGGAPPPESTVHISQKAQKKICSLRGLLLSRLVLQTKIKREAVQRLKLEDTKANNLRTYIWLCTPKQNSQQLWHTLNKILPSFSLLLIDFIPQGYYKHCSWRIRSLMQENFCQGTQIHIILAINIFTEY